MGTPVVSFEGKSHAGRVGASLLWGSGLGELVANDLRGYVEKAVDLGKHRDRLAEVRRGLRAKFQTSSVMDVWRMARGLESAYREAWRTDCPRCVE
jgi:predicted O-linked N-acetylglucosamine transferase (SPINDLY family)